MIEGKPYRWWLYSRSIRLMADGSTIAVLRRSHFGEKGKFTLDGVSYRIRSKGQLTFREAFLLECEGKPRATIESASRVLSGYVLNDGDHVYAFRKGGSSTVGGVRYSSKAFVLEDERRAIGVIDRGGFLNQGLIAHLPNALEIPVKILCIFVAATCWDRRRGLSFGSLSPSDE